MFTGIVQTTGRLARLDRSRGGEGPGGMRLVVEHDGWVPRDGPVRLGDSICVSGVCLTAAAITATSLGFDVIEETLAKTSLGDRRVDERVNLEPSLTPATPMGGHVVQGHVDGTGKVRRVQAGADWRLIIDAPDALMDYIVPKGSIAIDGVSLTIAKTTAVGFEVALIPTTLEETTLGELRPGQRVNLETDILSRTVIHWLKRQATREGGVTMDDLRGAGFIDG